MLTLEAVAFREIAPTPSLSTPYNVSSHVTTASPLEQRMFPRWFGSAGQWAIVGGLGSMLLAVLLPAIAQVREAARKSQCQDHLHNLAIMDCRSSRPAQCMTRSGFRVANRSTNR
jgi:hypothetical protein